MVQCPDCQKEQDADFGMVTCTSCGAVFMVEFDGSVNQPENIESDVSSSSGEAEPPSEENEDMSPANESTYDEDFLDPLSDSVETGVEAAPNDPLEIQKFDSLEASTLADGEYLYDILISGIDSGEIKKDLLQALSDKRFSLVIEDLRAKIRDGQLSIVGLNPVRAMLIVLKIQEMDVQIEWRQKHYTQGLEERTPGVEP